MTLFLSVLMNVAIWAAAIAAAYGLYRLCIHLRGERPVEHSFTSLNKGSAELPDETPRIAGQQENAADSCSAGTVR